jgi:hypothetical protein
LRFNLAILGQRIIRGQVNQGTEPSRTGSGRLACNLPHIEPSPWFLAQLRLQDACSRGFVRKIETYLHVESPFPYQGFIEAIEAIGCGHKYESIDRAVLVDRAQQGRRDVI